MTMLEQMAKAIYEKAYENSGWKPSWVDIFGQSREKYLDCARAALTALLDPTEEMKEAGTLELDKNQGLPASFIFRAMTQAALNEK